MRLRRVPLILLLMFGLLLAACDDGGGDSTEVEPAADDPAGEVTAAPADDNAGGDSGDDAEAAEEVESPAVEIIEQYLQARVDSDEERLYEITCAALEGEIPMQASSFAAVNASLQNVECGLDGSEGDFTLVTCEGAFVIEYGAERENSEIPLETYRALQEDGEWRACGEGGAGVEDAGPTPTPPE